ncbi:MAG: APC family permease [Candidatus Kapaibacterium sp.]
MSNTTTYTPHTPEHDARTSRKRRGKLRTMQLAAVVMMTISGGPYGLEPLMNYVGSHGAMALLLLTPLLWDIPTMLAVLELNSMMPVTGGYYQWVKRALGLRFAWYEGLWTWLYTFVDLAIYPVLFVEYVSFIVPEVMAFKVPICLLIIWSSAYLNIRGIVPVGKVSEVLGLAVITPFVVMLAVYVWNHGGDVGALKVPSPSLEGLSLASLGMGLYTVMWNFLGWDNVTTYADEVAKPVRSYVKSVGTSFVVIFLIYFIAIVLASSSGVDFSALEDKGFPMLGTVIGGGWLGMLVALGGMASGLGLYSSVLLSVSRIPKVMAEDGLLPSVVMREHPRYGTPVISILVCSVVVSIMIVLSFAELLIMDVIIYGAALSLEFVSLVVLRHREPHVPRPFRIPLPTRLLPLLFLVPMLVYATALVGVSISEEHALLPTMIALGVLVSGEVLWQLVKRRRTV